MIEQRGDKAPLIFRNTFINTMDKKDVLHKTTYIWKEDEGYAIIIKNDGMKAILNQIDTIVWKTINDEDTVELIVANISSKYNLDEQTVENSIQRLIGAGLVTCEDLFWGDDIL